MAGTTGFSQQDVERYPAVLPDPEQAQREAIARQEGEDLLFDTPHTMQEAEDTEIEDSEEDRTPAVAARPNRKVTKPAKIASQSRPGREVRRRRHEQVCPPGDGRSISRLQCREKSHSSMPLSAT
ncbi:hypothetical protein MAP00_001582 [Monascus purpureus]|nr:hypothetical protein MAP00_001582 [Monascus purpureus]